MRKVFENPTMKISLFREENVVTTSAYTNKVRSAVKAAGADGNNLTEMSYTDIF